MECPPECLDCRYPYRSNTRLYAAHGPLPLEDETTDSIHHKLSDAERYRVWLKDHGHSPPKPVWVCRVRRSLYGPRAKCAGEMKNREQLIQALPDSQFSKVDMLGFAAYVATEIFVNQYDLLTAPTPEEFWDAWVGKCVDHYLEKR